MECNLEQSCELITFLETSSPLGAAAQPVCAEQRREHIRHTLPAAGVVGGLRAGDSEARAQRSMLEGKLFPFSLLS